MQNFYVQEQKLGTQSEIGERGSKGTPTLVREQIYLNRNAGMRHTTAKSRNACTRAHGHASREGSAGMRAQLCLLI